MSALVREACERVRETEGGRAGGGREDGRARGREEWEVKGEGWRVSER